MGKFMRGDQMFYTRDNAWAKVGMSTKAVVECKVPTGAPSAAQAEVRNAFAAAAKDSIREYPADGTFRTLMARVKWIGRKLFGAVYAKRVLVPMSAIEDHPAIVRARARGQTAVRRGRGVTAPLARREELL